MCVPITFVQAAEQLLTGLWGREGPGMVAFSEVCFSASGLYLCCVGLEGDPPEGARRPLSCLPSQPLLGGGVPTTPQSLWSEHAPGQVWVMRPPPDRWRERPESLSSPSSSPHRGLCPCPSCWGREGEDEGGGEGTAVIEKGVRRNASGEVECEQSPEYAEEPREEGGEHTPWGMHSIFKGLRGAYSMI